MPSRDSFSNFTSALEKESEIVRYAPSVPSFVIAPTNEPANDVELLFVTTLPPTTAQFEILTFTPFALAATTAAPLYDALDFNVTEGFSKITPVISEFPVIVLMRAAPS